MISRAKRQPLYQQLAAKLVQDITNGKYQPGECLPSIRELAEFFEVTVPTVQKALRILVEDGTLYTKQGVGTFVNLPPVRRKKQIALVLPDISAPFYAEITKAVEMTCRKAGFNVVLYNTFYSEEEERACLSGLPDDQVCGVLVAPIPDTGNSQAYKRLLDSGLKTVFLVRAVEGVEAASVVTADYEGVQHLLEYLIRIGHERIGYIGSYPSNRRKVALEAFRHTLQMHNLELREEWIQLSSLSGIAGGKEGIVKILAQKEHPTAVFACNDLTAIGVIHGIQEVGLKVPDDMAVAGFDNIELAEYLQVPLTTMEQPKAEMGTLAARLLIDQINGLDVQPRQTVLYPQLIVRRSCGSFLAAQRSAQ